MSWSLTLSPRLSPAVVLGVSQETFRSARVPSLTDRADQRALSRPIFTPTHNSPKQLSAPCGAQLTLGVRNRSEEQPITAA